ncbi:4-(cytidine 5'-diphospho)-2-C-methyl-D-erythritol kinase [Bradyrhizobium sp.]|jgi:4-diphosphocytidyl-2-C-methyl-D-erythritol kinase|uniref:4-(cytidine 5'-diphospho)-2-C-methyl-D-erythritol kinase n=1 Tax=Bradyrhizobium sp. TaxID=376 RepID=UPI002D3E0852|nr:4-(cytidine 5'-diphospho)-2-C-methyl-D-erythritol kinase [Bradyrhizobium sp.]HZR74119.1 4-(cytidine 5'-diphospho)-2-C-methyl-D-erythritol kinase [Bradyrhizobium sp.]
MTSGGTTDAAVTSSAGELADEARAKVNLTLRVVGRRADGYHDLESVVAFADCADRLTLLPGEELRLATTGPLAAACGEVADNLVLKAARLLAERVPRLKTGTFTLNKVLPVAAGIGGGSADAAAALRLLARANDLAIDDKRLTEVAKLTGADVPVCVPSQPCVMTGVGESLLPLKLPKIPCVLVNPRIAVATKDVFTALGLRSGELLVGIADVIQAMVWPEAGASLEEWVEAFAASSNDLEEPAMRIEPVIGNVIAALNATNGAWLARMSGSGATCFAIYENTAEAGRAAEKIRSDHPTWWVHAGVLS